MSVKEKEERFEKVVVLGDNLKAYYCFLVLSLLFFCFAALNYFKYAEPFWKFGTGFTLGITLIVIVEISTHRKVYWREQK